MSNTLKMKDVSSMLTKLILLGEFSSLFNEMDQFFVDQKWLVSIMYTDLNGGHHGGQRLYGADHRV